MGSTYRHWFKILKSGHKVSINKNNPRGLIMATRIVEAGLATWDKEMDFFTYYMISPVERNQPTPEPVAQANKSVFPPVRVSFWREGDRAGLFSQQAYEVVNRDGEWVTYKNALGQRHTVKAIYTQVAA